MTTRINHINKSAPAPAGLVSASRFLLTQPGGVRIGGGPHVMGATNPQIVASFVDEISGALYPASGAWATLIQMNGVPVIDATDTQAVNPIASAAYALPPAIGAQTRFTQVALWQIPASFVEVRNVLLQTAAPANSYLSALRQNANGTIEARCRRASTDGAGPLLDMPSIGVGNWRAFALSMDYTSDVVRLHNLLTGDIVEAAIPGAPGTAPTTPAAYTFLGGGAGSSRFRGRVAYAAHLPYALTAQDVTALQLHTRALAQRLAA